MDLRTEWVFKGVTYTFTFPVSRAYARQHLKDREGIDV